MTEKLLVDYSEFAELVERESHVSYAGGGAYKCADCIKYSIVFMIGIILIMIGSLKRDMREGVRAVFILFGAVQSSVILYPCYEIYVRVLGAVQDDILNRNNMIL